MAYDDMLSAGFWGGLRMRPLGSDDAVNWDLPGGRTVEDIHPAATKFQRKEMPHAAAEEGDHWNRRLRANWKAHPAPKRMVDEMHRQLMLIHGVQDAPQPLEAVYMDWSDDPYGGAVHFWNPGYKPWEVMDAMTQPVEDFPCYICGEAYSMGQTWVEGALQTAEIVLQKRLGLPEPKWLSHA
jgi:monoamine oxidase